MAVLTKPITTTSVGNILGTSSGDVGTLCTHSGINKMSKIKPIDYPENGVMSTDKFRGTATAIAEGINYGLNAGCADNNPYYAHSSTWAYSGGPKGGLGVSPYRLLDFDGYDSSAQPTIFGDGLVNGQTIKYNSTDTQLTVSLWWNYDNNTTGVNILEMIWGAGATKADANNTYMYIVVGSYMTMMYNGSATSAKAIYDGTEYKTFKCPPLPSSLQSTGNKSVSIVVGPYLSSALPGTWLSLSSSTLLSVSGKFVTLAYAAGLSLKFEYLSTIPIVVTNFAMSISGDNVTCTWTKGTNWSSYSSKRRVRFIVSQKSGNKETQGSSGTTVTVGNVTSITSYLSTIMSNAGFIPYSGDGFTYVITAYFQYKDSSSVWQNQTSVTQIKVY